MKLDSWIDYGPIKVNLVQSNWHEVIFSALLYFHLQWCIDLNQYNFVSAFLFLILQLKRVSVLRIFLLSLLDVTASQPWVSLQSQALSSFALQISSDQFMRKHSSHTSSCSLHCFQTWHGFRHAQFTRIWKSMRGRGQDCHTEVSRDAILKACSCCN